MAGMLRRRSRRRRRSCWRSWSRPRGIVRLWRNRQRTSKWNTTASVMNWIRFFCIFIGLMNINNYENHWNYLKEFLFFLCEYYIFIYFLIIISRARAVTKSRIEAGKYLSFLWLFLCLLWKTRFLIILCLLIGSNTCNDVKYNCFQT